MRAWWLEKPGPIDGAPLRLGERPDPRPGAREVLVSVAACAVCRTDLHLAEGDLEPHGPRTIPGHEVVGRVVERGRDATRFAVGDRVGIAWLRSTCGSCRFCVTGRENLCVQPMFTGWDTDGGYADLAVVPEAYAYRLPEAFTDTAVAPLLCAGIIGYRALRQTRLPSGGRLGIYGFGASAHLAAQVAVYEGARVHVATRSESARQLAMSLGVESVGDTTDPPPEPLDGAILFAPSGDLVPVALRALDRGGTLAIAGIHLTEIPALRYSSDLFFEREMRSVTANTRQDGQDFLDIAARVPIETTVTPYPFNRAADALADLAHGRVTGAAVIVNHA